MKEHYDFSEGKRGAVIKTNKEKITIRLDPEVLQWFRDQVKGGGNYQTLINEALKAHITQQGESLESTLRRVIREEMQVRKIGFAENALCYTLQHCLKLGELARQSFNMHVSLPSTPDIEALQTFIEQHPRLLVLTGAGISLESGIPTYRDHKGVWQGTPPMQHNDFIRHEAVRQRYWARSFLGRSTVANAYPNRAHYALAELEKAGCIRLLVTQNVDNLHQRAGSHQVVDLHGNLRDVICLDCGSLNQRDDMQTWLESMNPHLQGLQATIRPDGDAILDDAHVSQVRIPACPRCTGVLMPDVVFFGGTIPPTRVEYCLQALREADALLVVGSSLKVYSGYRFCLRAQEWGKPIALLNPGSTRADALASLHIKQPCADALDSVIKQMAI